MRSAATTFCLSVAAIVLAVSVGDNLFQAVVVDPVWSTSPPDSLRTVASSPYSARLKAFHTNPLFLIGPVCLLASPFLAWNQPRVRIWLLIPAACYLAVILATLFYSWPINNLLFGRADDNPDAATVIAMTRRWIFADRIRYAFRVASFLCVVRALAGH